MKTRHAAAALLTPVYRALVPVIDAVIAGLHESDQFTVKAVACGYAVDCTVQVVVDWKQPRGLKVILVGAGGEKVIGGIDDAHVGSLEAAGHA